MQALLESLPSLIGGGFAFIAIVSLYLWAADDMLSKAARERLGAALAGDRVADRPVLLADIGALLDRTLPWRTAPGTYLLNVLLLSFLAMLAVGILYFARTGGFWLQFEAGDAGRRNFLAQLLFDGLLKVYLVNLVGLLPHRAYVARLAQGSAASAVGLLVMDVALREALLLALSALVWAGFVLLFGSFGGDLRLAWGALLPTYAAAGRFQNLTGIYVYAVAATSLPLCVAVLVRLLTASPRGARALRTILFVLPWQDKPVRALSLLAAVLMMLFGLLGSALLTPFLRA